MDEFQLIQAHFNRGYNNPLVSVGIGDDCALIKAGSDDWAMSIDTVVEGVHFPVGATAFDIGTRALCCALSDLAAMGAKAQFFTLALTLKQVDAQWLEAFSQGLFEVADAFDCPLIGGDTTRGPLCVSVQVHGTVAAGKALLRSGAKPGDRIFVSGTLGDGAAALAWLNGELKVEGAAARYLHQRFYRPQPQMSLGNRLAGWASAAIDLSDGLMADLNHICEASGVRAEIDAEHLPLSPLWSGLVSQSQRLSWALTGGDDYQLAFCMPPEYTSKLAQWGLPVTDIGSIKASDATGPQAKVEVRTGEGVLTTGSYGYTHFD